MLTNTIDIENINKRFEEAQPTEIIDWANTIFGNQVALMSSFGVEDMVIWDIMWRINNKARIMTLDTLRLPTETYTLMDRVKYKYKVDIEVFYPDIESVGPMIKQHGFNLFYRGVENRKMCCGIRKVEPLNRALNGLDAWITGLRRDQGMARSTINIVEFESHRKTYKISPLANWAIQDVWNYAKENRVIYNELHDKNYPSIGCAPCTRAVHNGEDIRAGRWWWESDPSAKECGLHLTD